MVSSNFFKYDNIENSANKEHGNYVTLLLIFIVIRISVFFKPQFWTKHKKKKILTLYSFTYSSQRSFKQLASVKTEMLLLQLLCCLPERTTPIC